MLIPLMVMVAVASLVAAIWYIYGVTTQQKAIQERLRRALDLPEPPKSLLMRYRNRFNETEGGQELAKQLHQAGLSFTPFDFQLIRFSAIAILIMLLTRIMALSWMWSLTAAMLLVTVGSKAFLKARQGSLGHAVGKQLPEAVRVLGSGLHAGLSVQQGIAMVAREIAAPLGPLLQRTVHELQLGIPLEEALDNLTRRVSNRDLQFVVTTILLQHEIGGDLAGALDQIGATLVERNAVDGEIQTATAEQRYVAMVLPLVPVAGVVLLSAGKPGYAAVLWKPLGLIVLGVSVLLQVIGFWLINRTARIKV